MNIQKTEKRKKGEGREEERRGKDRTCLILTSGNIINWINTLNSTQTEHTAQKLYIFF